MALSASILIFGHDHTLLDTRRWVLERAGFEVRAVAAMPAVMAAVTAGSPALVILCHTLTAEERRAVIATASNLEPPIKTLAITTTHHEVGEAGVAGEVLDSMAGALALIAAARKVLGETPA